MIEVNPNAHRIEDRSTEAEKRDMRERHWRRMGPLEAVRLLPFMQAKGVRQHIIAHFEEFLSKEVHPKFQKEPKKGSLQEAP